MHQDLELKVLLALIVDMQGSRQPVLRQGDTVDKTELVRPSLPELLAQHVMGETKIQLDGEIARPRVRRGLAQELPGGVTREAMLGQGRSGMVLRGRTENLSSASSRLASGASYPKNLRP